MKTILIFGGSGFIGRHLVDELMEDYKIIILSRDPSKTSAFSHNNVTVEQYSPEDVKTLIPLFEKSTGIINLSGQNIGEKSWSKDFKDQILKSRIEIGSLIKNTFDRCENKPSFFIQSSAVHYYGVNPTDAEIKEDRPSTRDCFLTMVAVQAEENVRQLENQTRLIYARTGIVLDKVNGALSKMAMPIKMFVGGPLGNGKQWVSWIYINDIVRAFHFIIENENISRGVNLTAPHPVRQKDFAKAIGKAIHRPAFFPAPAIALRLILGKDRANDLLLSGLNVIPDKLLKAGFKFQFETIEEGLNEIYRMAI